MKNKKYPKGHFITQGLVIGIPIGIPIGLAIGNIALGPAIGVGIGIIIGKILEDKYEKEGKIRPITKNEKKKKKIGLIVGIVALIIGLIVGLTAYSFLKVTKCDSSKNDCNIAGNEEQKKFSEATTVSLPEGYTLDSYTVDKVTDETCKQDADCETPMEYLVQSRCPFTSLCLENKCTVVCPDVKTMEIQGVITHAQPEMDGSIITIESNGEFYEALVSIPNLGEEYVSHIKNIEIGKYIQVIGNPIKIKDSERIIASQIYVEGAFTGEHPCNIEPDPGNCEAAMPRYYFDKEERECKEFLWGGCDGIVPFDNLEVCKATCIQLNKSPK